MVWPMRYVKVVLIPEDGGLHPAAAALDAEPQVQLDAILHVNLLNDGTAVTLFEHRGNPDRLATILDEEDSVVKYNVAEVEEGIQAYVHSYPTETGSKLLRLMQEHEFVVDTPLRFNPQGALRVSVIGDEETVQRALNDIPEGVRVELERLSDYEPEQRYLTSMLTDRQQEILDAAVSLGYYEVPRRATHEDIAAELDLSTTTVGEHLRKIEARMLSEIAR